MKRAYELTKKDIVIENDTELIIEEIAYPNDPRMKGEIIIKFKHKQPKYILKTSLFSVKPRF